MKTKQIIDTLQEYSDWRRAKGKWDVDAFNAGESLFDTISAHEIGLALDAAIERLQTLEKERDEAREAAVGVRGYCQAFTGLHRKLPWEEGTE